MFLLVQLVINLQINLDNFPTNSSLITVFVIDSLKDLFRALLTSCFERILADMKQDPDHVM